MKAIGISFSRYVVQMLLNGKYISNEKKENRHHKTRIEIVGMVNMKTYISY
jgi:hypothetical protein